MKASPLELRSRIVEAVDRQTQTIEEVADIFGVTQRYVYKLLKMRRETGDLSPLPHGGGAEAKLDEPQLRKLSARVAEFPDQALDELRDLRRRRLSVQVCINTVWRALQQLGLTLKKSRRAREANPSERAAFSEKQVTLPAARLMESNKVPVRRAAWDAKEVATFSDTIAYVRRYLWNHQHFQMSPTTSDMIKVPRFLLERLTETLCYAA